MKRLFSSSNGLPFEELAHEEFGLAMICCSFSVIHGARVEIPTTHEISPPPPP
jgi:hypothetical protein